MVIVDTSIIIDHLRTLGDRQSWFEKILNDHQDVRITTLVIHELYRGTSTRNHDKEKELLATISGLGILGHTYEIGKLGGELSRDYGLSVVDATIAATCLLNAALLYTLNTKDFSAVPNLKIVSLE